MWDSRLPLSVVTFKWGNKYSARHVNTLRAMFRRNTTIDHDFYCITDDPRGLDEWVKVIPLWDDHRDMGRCWTRLKLLSHEMRELIGSRICHADLDTVICGDLDPLLRRTEEFIIWLCPSKGERGVACNPSFMLFDAGCHDEIYRKFARDPEGTKVAAWRDGWTGSDQAVLGHLLPPGTPFFTAADGLISLRDDMKKGRKDPPPGALLVGMYGGHDPADRGLQARYPWIKYHWRSLRMDLLDMLIKHRGWCRGVEVGVLRGDLFFYLLKRNPDLELIGVDAWKHGDGPLRAKDGYRSYQQHPLDEYAERVKAGAREIGMRAQVRHMTSLEAAQRVADESMDFVFIDADHTEKAVREDIAAWLPKVRPGGWLLGHDTHFPGVRAAIDDLLPEWRQWPDHVWSIEKGGAS